VVAQHGFKQFVQGFTYEIHGLVIEGLIGSQFLEHDKRVSQRLNIAPVKWVSRHRQRSLKTSVAYPSKLEVPTCCQL
jgi:hypothetical protein